MLPTIWTHWIHIILLFSVLLPYIKCFVCFCSAISLWNSLPISLSLPPLLILSHTLLPFSHSLFLSSFSPTLLPSSLNPSHHPFLTYSLSPSWLPSLPFLCSQFLSSPLSLFPCSFFSPPLSSYPFKMSTKAFTSLTSSSSVENVLTGCLHFLSSFRLIDQTFWLLWQKLYFCIHIFF